MTTLTGKQCMTARLLLKWNLRELAFRSMVKTSAIDQYERGLKMLFPAQRELLSKTFKQAGIEFLDFGEVRLSDEDGEREAVPASKPASAGPSGESYSVAPSELSALLKPPSPLPPREEEPLPPG